MESEKQARKVVAKVSVVSNAMSKWSFGAVRKEQKEERGGSCIRAARPAREGLKSTDRGGAKTSQAHSFYGLLARSSGAP